MDTRTLFFELAECWQRAARQTTHEGLRSCYAERAARYLDMIREIENRGEPTIPRPAVGDQ